MWSFVMKFCLFSAICVLPLLISSDDVYCRSYDKNYNDNYNSENSLDNDSSFQDSNDAEESKMYPFVKADQLQDDEVLGIIVSESGTYALGSDKRYIQISASTSNTDSSSYSNSKSSSGSSYSSSSYSSSDGDGTKQVFDFGFFDRYPNLYSVELRKISISVDQMEQLQKYLPANLQSLSFNQCKIKPFAYKNVAAIIGDHSKLTVLKIVDPSIDGTTVDELLDSASSLSKLISVNFTFGGISSDGLSKLTKLFESSVNTLKYVTLGFGEVEYTDAYADFMKAFGRLEKLENLEFALLKSSPDIAMKFVQSLSGLKNLHSLKFNFRDIRDQDSVAIYNVFLELRKVIEELRELEVIDISSMNLFSDNIQVIASALGNLPSLKTLNLSGNFISKEAAATISEALKNCSSLVTLIMNSCGITDEVLSELCSQMEGSIKYWYLRNNKIKDGASNLPLSKLPDIKLIDLSRNYMDYNAALAVVKLTEGHSALGIINFKDNSGIINIPSSKLIDYHDKLNKWEAKNNSKITFFGL